MATISQPINAAVMPHLNFDFVKDFSPIVLVSTIPNLLVVNPSLGVKTVRELIALAKAKPTASRSAPPASRTGTHLAAELFKVLTGVEMVHVPYARQRPGDHRPARRPHPARVHARLDRGPARARRQAGRARRRPRRSAPRSRPRCRPWAEAGLPGFDTGLWFGLLAPAGTPKAAIDRINAAVNQAIKSEEVIKALQPQGIDLLGGTPDEFARYIASEMERWDKVARAAGLKK